MKEKLAGTQVDIEQIPIPEDVDMEDSHGGKKRRGLLVEAITHEEIEATILHSMEAMGIKPEDCAEMIQRCLAKKAQQRMENGKMGMWRKTLIFDYLTALRVNGKFTSPKIIKEEEKGRMVV